MDTNEFMLVNSRRKDMKKGKDERMLDGIETSLDSHEIKLNRERQSLQWHLRVSSDWEVRSITEKKNSL